MLFKFYETKFQRQGYTETLEKFRLTGEHFALRAGVAT
jgi:hypothetical protein